MGFIKKHQSNEKLREEIREGYGSGLDAHVVSVDATETRKKNLAKKKAEEKFNRYHKKFKDNAFQLDRLLTKERYSKNSQRKELANKTTGDLNKLSDALDALKNANGDQSVITSSIANVNLYANNLKKHANHYTVSKGRKIAGVLMIVAGIAMMAASSTLAFFSAGLALPVSIPLAAGGLALSTAGGATLFTRSRIHRKIDKAIDHAEKTVKQFSAAKR
jgi:hypothetical protein